MLNDTSLQAFYASSGISANALSLFIRTALLVGFLMWAAWCVLELLKYHKQHRNENISTLLSNYVQVFFLISIMIALVFIK